MYRSTLLIVVLATLATTSNASAQQVHWRTDYNKAWKEACDSNKPLFVEVGSAACTWCRRFEETTCRNPEVVRQLNDQFIPVKLDGDHNPKFVAALNIRAYPCLVFGTGDGKVLGISEGFVDVIAFRAQCDTALAQIPPTERVVTNPATLSDSEVVAAMAARVGIVVSQRLTADKVRDIAKAYKTSDYKAARQSIGKMFETNQANVQPTAYTVADR